MLNSEKKYILQLKDVHKSYGDDNEIEVIKGVSLDIEQGSFCCLMGRNGAGKSTILKLISGLAIPTAGTILINGLDVVTNKEEALRTFGIMHQFRSLDVFTPLRELLINHGLLFIPSYNQVVQQVDFLLDLVDLTSKKDEFIKNLSGGMQQRAKLAQALIHSPKLIVLDEPTAGVDVSVSANIWNYLKQLNEQGATILLTTNIIDDVARMGSRFIFLRNGVIAQDLQRDEIQAVLPSAYELTVDKPLSKKDAAQLKNSPVVKQYSLNIDIEKNNIQLEFSSSIAFGDVLDRLEIPGYKIMAISSVESLKLALQKNNK